MLLRAKIHRFDLYYNNRIRLYCKINKMLIINKVIIINIRFLTINRYKRTFKCQINKINRII